MPGDKSIAHRWLILASTARGSSRLVDLPGSLDVRSTASCLAARDGSTLDLHLMRGLATMPSSGRVTVPRGTSTLPTATIRALRFRVKVVKALVAPSRSLDCGNSGTAMRLLAGVMAGAPFSSVLTGDASLSERPMERVATPLREMGATVRTTSGHAPLHGRGWRPARHRLPRPGGQRAGQERRAARGDRRPTGRTTVTEPAATRDHTERALAALGAPVEVEGSTVRVEPFQHEGFEARCPGDPSSAAFLVAAAGAHRLARSRSPTWASTRRARTSST